MDFSPIDGRRYDERCACQTSPFRTLRCRERDIRDDRQVSTPLGKVGRAPYMPVMSDDPTCPLCQRPIPRDARQSLHHLIPKLKGGKGGPTVLVHQICHNEIHAALTEAELARQFNTPEALRAHPRLARFIRWVASKPPTFHSRTTKNPNRRRR